MGKPRFQQLETLLPDDVMILGIDEHTACVIDLETRQMDIRGIGNVTVRKTGREIKFKKGEQVPLETLVKEIDRKAWKPADIDEVAQTDDPDALKTNLLSKVL